MEIVLLEFIDHLTGERFADAPHRLLREGARDQARRIEPYEDSVRNQTFSRSPHGWRTSRLSVFVDRVDGIRRRH
jgi:hypothetical protein